MISYNTTSRNATKISQMTVKIMPINIEYTETTEMEADYL